jgi:myosin-crossreactive antigen
MSEEHFPDDARFYLVGGGIASLAAAAFHIRDGNIKGSQLKTEGQYDNRHEIQCG